MASEARLRFPDQHFFHGGRRIRFNGVGRRRHPRRAYCQNIESCVTSRPSRSILVGASVDLSDSGLCMYSFEALGQGEDIKITNEIPVPYQKAVVKWVKNYAIDLYKVGVMFVP